MKLFLKDTYTSKNILHIKHTAVSVENMTGKCGWRKRMKGRGETKKK